MVPLIHKSIYRPLTNNWKKQYVLPDKSKKPKLPHKQLLPSNNQLNFPYPRPKWRRPYSWVLTMNWPTAINRNRLAMNCNWAIPSHQLSMNWLWIQMKIQPIWMIETKGIYYLLFFSVLQMFSMWLHIYKYKLAFKITMKYTFPNLGNTTPLFFSSNKFLYLAIFLKGFCNLAVPV